MEPRAGAPGYDYAHSLKFLNTFQAEHPPISTKSGIVANLGETDDEILDND